MIRAAAIFVALAAAASAASASTVISTSDSGREVVNVDHGPGHRLMIVREPDAGDDQAWMQGGREAITYRDGSGEQVNVFADHPVSREEIAEARREADQARAEGRRAAAAARAEADQARAEGEREAREGRREAEQARAESERAAEEARREARQAREKAEWR